jgi:hypothetical protein
VFALSPNDTVLTSHASDKTIGGGARCAKDGSKRGILPTNRAISGPEGTGGGINNRPGGTVSLSGGSSVSGNSPDNCVGTPAC